VWRLRDKLDQLAIFLVKEPPPKAEDRPATRWAWPIPDVWERRPKDVPPRQIADPGADLTGDPAFALRKEEFEQWLVRRKEVLEMRYAAKQDELAKSFEAKVKARVEARMAKENANGRVFTKKQFMAIVRCLHNDRRKAASAEDLDAAFGLFWGARDRLMYVMDKKGKKMPFTPPVAPDPEPPQEGGPSAGALS
jgi:hypothetical protein